MKQLKGSKNVRQKKYSTPFGWTAVKETNEKGNEVQVLRCPYVHLNQFTNKYERCSYTCRKDRTMGPH